MKSIEKEIKYQLLREDFYKFRSFLDDNKYTKIRTVKQVNYYIDTEDLIFKNKHITARIRKIIDSVKNKYEFTIKAPCDDVYKQNIKINNEFSISLNQNIAEDIINKGELKQYIYLFGDVLTEYKNEIDLEKVRIIGQLETERVLYSIAPGYDPINIDTSYYLGEYDYEVEWETDNIDEAKKLLIAIFNDIGINTIDNDMSKNVRFFNKYLSNNGII